MSFACLRQHVDDTDIREVRKCMSCRTVLLLVLLLVAWTTSNYINHDYQCLPAVQLKCAVWRSVLYGTVSLIMCW